MSRLKPVTEIAHEVAGTIDEQRLDTIYTDCLHVQKSRPSGSDSNITTGARMVRDIIIARKWEIAKQYDGNITRKKFAQDMGMSCPTLHNCIEYGLVYISIWHKRDQFTYFPLMESHLQHLYDAQLRFDVDNNNVYDFALAWQHINSNLMTKLQGAMATRNDITDALNKYFGLHINHSDQVVISEAKV